MWFECWGGALRDEINTAARETRLRGVYLSEGRGGEGRGGGAYLIRRRWW